MSNLIKQLNELNLDSYKHIKNNDWDGSDKLKEWLVSKNFRKIGEGGYATVYSSDTEKFVVKVNDGHFDSNYLRFVNFCHKNKANPHIPKIGKVKTLNRDDGDKWFVVFIEKLNQFDIEKVFGVERNQYEKLLDFFYQLICLNDGSTINYKMIKSQLKSSDLEETPYSKQLVDVCNTILDIADTCDIDPKDFLDMHDENLMMRGNTIVIIDPFAS